MAPQAMHHGWSGLRSEGKIMLISISPYFFYLFCHCCIISLQEIFVSLGSRTSPMRILVWLCVPTMQISECTPAATWPQSSDSSTFNCHVMTPAKNSKFVGCLSFKTRVLKRVIKCGLLMPDLTVTAFITSHHLYTFIAIKRMLDAFCIWAVLASMHASVVIYMY